MARISGVDLPREKRVEISFDKGSGLFINGDVLWIEERIWYYSEVYKEKCKKIHSYDYYCH